LEKQKKKATEATQHSSVSQQAQTRPESESRIGRFFVPVVIIAAAIVVYYMFKR